jgi:hypothetical protein
VAGIALAVGFLGVIAAFVLLGGRPGSHPPGQRPSFVNVTVGEELVPEVEETGFHFQEYHRGQPFRWTNGSARLAIPIDRTKPPEAVLIRLASNRPPAVGPARLKIVVSGRTLFENTIPYGPWERTFDLRGPDLGDQVTVDLLSDTFNPLGSTRGGGQATGGDPRDLGVQVMGVKLLRSADAPAADPVRAIGARAQWEWSHPRGIAFGAITAYGRSLVTAGWDSPVRTWDAAAGQPRADLPGGAPELNAVALSPDGKAYAAVTRDRVVRVRDTTTAEDRAAFAGHKGQVLALAYSPDGKTLVSAGDDNENGGELKLWDLEAGGERVPVEPFPFRLWGVAYAPDGKSVAVVGADRSVQVVDTATGKVLTSYPLPFDGRSVAFSPDGALLAVAYGQDGGVRVFAREGGRARPDFHAPGSACVLGLGFTPDGRRLLTPAADGTTTLWDVSTPQARAVARLEGHEGPVRFALFLPDGRTAVTGGEDRIIRLWDVGGTE